MKLEEEKQEWVFFISLHADVYHLKGLMRGRETGCANKAAPQTGHRNWVLKESRLALLLRESEATMGDHRGPF